jgi:hypothetical protein
MAVFPCGHIPGVPAAICPKDSRAGTHQKQKALTVVRALVGWFLTISRVKAARSEIIFVMRGDDAGSLFRMSFLL